MIDPEGRAAAPAGMAGRPLWRDLPILIVIIAGLFHLGRGATVDGLVFVALGVALAVAELRDRAGAAPDEDRPAGPRAPLAPRWIALGALVCLGYGLLVGPEAPASPGVVVAVAIPGLLILPVAWRGGPAPGPAPSGQGPGRAKWLWALVMSLACLWELVSFLSQPDPRTDSYQHPTVSALLNPLFGSAGVRTVVLGVWLAIGLWLARRLSTAPSEERA